MYLLSNIPHIPEEEIMSFERAKLTKKNLMAFKEGLFIESNVQKKLKSIYTAYVSPVSQRGEQWETIKKVKADGRICNIYKNENEMIKYYEDRDASLAVFSMGERIKLLKKTFLNLPDGYFIVSNIGWRTPAYSGEIAAMGDREQQWKEIRGQNLQGTTFVVLKNEKEKDEYLSSISKAFNYQMSKKNIKN